MSRWTVLLIPHTSDAPRAIQLSERSIRAVASGAVALGAVTVIGLATIVAGLWRLGTPSPAVAAQAADPAGATTAASELAALRAKVHTLRTTLDTIQAHDARLQRVVSVVPTADSLLQHAATVSTALESLADSVTSLGADRAERAPKGTRVRTTSTGAVRQP